MSGLEATFLIVIALAAGYFVYVKEFKQKDCGCGNKGNCHKKQQRG
ncbi:FeoB-associated Cys-rich membrane protein [Campylobacter sp. CCUG 57310]|nr:FeoB-associated Cys-rich membrane protein [Campylobacter sp. CCUG 57310]QKF91654.1 hypothetical protein CORI_0428 [Campylobacter sp. CCUG 57310]